MRVDLPGGHSAEFREKMTYGERKRYTLALEKSEGTDLEQAYGSFERLIATLIQSWTLPEPMPTPDDWSVLDSLDCDIVDALQKGVDQAAKGIFPNLSPNPDPDSPTQPSPA